MKQFLTLTILLTVFKSNCQQMGYRNGLIVTQTNDTIACMVPIATSFEDKIKVKKTADSDEETMPLNKIKYLVNSTNLYENVAYKVKGKEISKLMWLEIEGKLNLYLEIVSNAGRSNSFSGGRMNYYESPTKNYVIKKADSTFLIEEKHFIETIKPVISDNPDVLSKVVTKVYKFDNMEDLVKDYNNAIKTN
jgi:hypothetical protein